MTVETLIKLLQQQPRFAEVKLSLMEGSIGGADLSIELSEDWPNAVVIFAEPESR